MTSSPAHTHEASHETLENAQASSTSVLRWGKRGLGRGMKVNVLQLHSVMWQAEMFSCFLPLILTGKGDLQINSLCLDRLNILPSTPQGWCLLDILRSVATPRAPCCFLLRDSHTRTVNQDCRLLTLWILRCRRAFPNDRVGVGKKKKSPLIRKMD